jgi:hypothetical protein
MLQCLICGLKFAEEKRLDIHNKTHEKSKAKNKTKRKTDMPDFEKPDFSLVLCCDRIWSQHLCRVIWIGRKSNIEISLLF